MASRIAVDIPTTITAVATIDGTSKVEGTYFLNVANRTAAPNAFRLAVTESSTTPPNLADYLNFDTVVQGNGGVVGRWPFPLRQGQVIWAKCNSTGLSLQLFPFERV